MRLAAAALQDDHEAMTRKITASGDPDVWIEFVDLAALEGRVVASLTASGGATEAELRAAPTPKLDPDAIFARLNKRGGEQD